MEMRVPHLVAHGTPRRAHRHLEQSGNGPVSINTDHRKYITQSMVFVSFFGAIYTRSASGAAPVSRGPSGVAWIVCVDDYGDQERNSLTCQLPTSK